ncbi:MAG: nucleotide pyrophosphohydrolase [Undibacterium sp.]|nr:nucleotide pyrophosphohydrolase [Undibacterium sp.]
MSKVAPTLESLRDQLRQFAQEREWQAFHTPKNLACALAVEASELLENFQWLNTGELTELDQTVQLAVQQEMADVLNYLLMLADRLQVNLLDVAEQKIALNAQKYPIALARGNAKKYHQIKNE